MAIELLLIVTLGLLAAVVVSGNGNGRPDEWDHERRCIALKSDGSGRCKHYAIRGGKVCKYHGGAAPQVQRAAKDRVLSDLYGPMIAGLRRLLDSSDLDAIAKACAILARQYGNDIDAGRLPGHMQNAAKHLEWIELLETDELIEIQSILASYEELARERQAARLNGAAATVRRALPTAEQLTVIDVEPVRAGKPHEKPGALVGGVTNPWRKAKRRR
jgi:hypothetical protein